jgi:AcrR family transcriptional regulator
MVQDQSEDADVGEHEDTARRGRRPRRSLADVVTAAVALADADGLAAVSMRTVAARLGTGAMSLYSYVPDKETLIGAMIEHVSGEQALPDAPSGDWRADLSALARGQRDLLLRHPWVIEALSHRQPLGPNALAALEFAAAALEPTGQPPGTRLETFALLTGFVVNVVRGELADAAAATTAPAAREAQLARLLELLATGRYPHVATAIAEASTSPPADLGERFEHLLARMLDGLGGPQT